MADTLKATIYLFCMGMILYVLSLFTHQWATLLQQGTEVCIGGIALLFVWRVVIILGSSRSTQRAAQPAATTIPARKRRTA